jgi:outer membrane protein assembly factor BamD (BamD/ComL family)
VARTEKLTRKDLRQPDEFQTLSRQALEWVEQNRTAVMAALGAVIVVLIAVVAYQMISQSREDSAATAYVEARALLTDKKYKEAAGRFDEVANRYGSTSYGSLALLERGNALLLSGQAAEAASAYQRYLQSSPATDYLRQLGHTRLGYAQEQAGKPREAQQSFAAAAAEPGPFSAEALFGAARNAEAAGDTTKAKDFYAQLLEKHPATNYRAVATAHLVALGGTPPDKGKLEAAAQAADAGSAQE